MSSAVRLRSGVCLTINAPDEVVAVRNGRVFQLSGGAYGMVTALIDGVRSAGTIAAALAGELNTETVFYVLELLRRHEFLADEGVCTGSSGPSLRDLIQVDQLFDIGCNRGQFLLAALGWWKPSRVLAVDMQADELEWARRNVALCRLPTLVEYVCCAVGPKAGVSEYWKSDFSPASSLTSMSQEEQREFGLQHSMERREPCLIRTIDEIRAEAGLESIDLLKIDIEGYELPALSAASETLERTANILIETGFGGIREHGLDAFCEFLHPRGFTPGHIVNTLYSASGKLLLADVLFSRRPRSKLWMSH